MWSEGAEGSHVQRLERLTELGPFVAQLEQLMSTSIRVPADAVLREPPKAPTHSRPHQPHPPPERKPRNVFSVRGIWSEEAERDAALSSLYNFSSLKSRGWLRNLLMEESDSDSNGEHLLSQEDLGTLLSIHRCRRKYQKDYHNDILNSQYTYYAAGLLSDQDRFPQNQAYVCQQYGFPLPPDDAQGPAQAPAQPFPLSQHPPTQHFSQ